MINTLSAYHRAPPSCRRDLNSFDGSFRDFSGSLFFFIIEHLVEEIFRVFERVLFHVLRLNSLQLKIVLPFNSNEIKFFLNSLPSLHCFSRVLVGSCLVIWDL